MGEEQQATVLVAKTSAVYRSKDGENVQIRKGRTTATAGHPVTRGFEHFWEPLVPTFNSTNSGRSKRR